MFEKTSADIQIPVIFFLLFFLQLVLFELSRSHLKVLPMRLFPVRRRGFGFLVVKKDRESLVSFSKKNPRPSSE